MEVKAGIALAASEWSRMGREGISAPQAILLILAFIGLAAVLISILSRHRRKSGSRERIGREGSPFVVESVHRDVEELMTRLDDLARQVHGRLDARLDRLERAIRDADQCVESLSRLARQADGRPAVDVTLPEVPPSQPEPPSDLEELSPHSAVYRLADLGLPAPAIAKETGRPTGEIELILSLRRVRVTAGDREGVQRSAAPR